MGSWGSKSTMFHGATSEKIQEYVELTYLNKYEIMKLLTQFSELTHKYVDGDIRHRESFNTIENMFDQIKYNPFKDRICDVFSSQRDQCFSFEDLLDFCSAMSESCPTNVKAAWAFKLYDFDEDGKFGLDDAMNTVRRLHVNSSTKSDYNEIAKRLLKEMDSEDGFITSLKFEHIIEKIEEFPGSFSFRI